MKELKVRITGLKEDYRIPAGFKKKRKLTKSQDLNRNPELLKNCRTTELQKE
jgi:hypothetical protein